MWRVHAVWCHCHCHDGAPQLTSLVVQSDQSSNPSFLALAASTNTKHLGINANQHLSSRGALGLLGRHVSICSSSEACWRGTDKAATPRRRNQLAGAARPRTRTHLRAARERETQLEKDRDYKLKQKRKAQLKS